MKNYVFSVMLASLAVAGAQEVSPAWSYSLPDTGLLPSAFSYDYVSSMRERHSGASHFGMQNVSLTIPFADPYKSSIYGWAFNAELNATATFVDADGSLDLESDTLCRATLPLALIHSKPMGERVVLAFAPTLSSDLVRGVRCYDFGFFGSWTKPLNERFSFSIGLAVYPRFARYYAVPLFGFEWRPTDDWLVELKAYRLRAMYTVNERLTAGFFASSEGGLWTVETERGSRLLNIQSLVVGITGEYDFSQAGQRKRIITASLGSTVATSVRFHECSGDRDADEAHHYRPGLYASFGVDFRF